MLTAGVSVIVLKTMHVWVIEMTRIGRRAEPGLI